MSDHDVDAVRGLLSGSDPGVSAPDAASRERMRQRSEQRAEPSPRTRGPWWPQILQAAVVAALVAGGASLLLLGGGDRPQQGSGEQLAPFGERAAAPLAERAASQPERDGVEHLLLEREPMLVNSFGPALEIWAGDGRQYELQGKLAGGELNPAVEFFYDSSASLSCIGRPPNRPPDCSLPLPQGVELSTDPDELREQIEAEIDAALSEGHRSIAASLNPEDGVFGLTEPASLDDLDPTTRTALVAEETFSRLIILLADSLASPEVRAAAFAVLGELEGIEILGEGRDRLGRPATVIGFRPPPASAKARADYRLFGAGSSYRLFVDPASTEILEFRANPETDDPFYEVITRREQVDSLPPGAEPFIQEVVAQTPAG